MAVFLKYNRFIKRSGGWIFIFGVLLFEKGISQTLESLCRPALYNYSHQSYKAQRQNWKIAQSPTTHFMYFANSKGLLEFDGTTWKVYELPARQIVRSVWVDTNGLIYTGALGEFGFWKQDMKGRQVYHSLKQKISDEAFKNEEIWHIIKTPSGILFQSFAFVYLYQNGAVRKLKTPGNVLFTFKTARAYYVEVIDKGLFTLEGETFRWVPSSAFLGKEAIYGVMDTFDPEAVVIATAQGLYRFDGKKFSVFSQEAHAFIKANQLNAALRLKNGNYVFGTIRNGLILTDNKGQVRYHFNQKNGLQNNTVLALAEDVDGNVWMGLDKGISMLALSSPFTYFEDPEGTIGTVYDLVVFRNTLYLATNHGVFYKSLMKPSGFQLIPNLQGQAWDLEVFDGQLICGHNNGTYLIEHSTATQLSTITGGWMIRRSVRQPAFLLQSTYTKLCVYAKNARGKWAFSHSIDEFSNPTFQLEELSDGRWMLNTKNNGLMAVELSDDYKRVIKTLNVGFAAENLLKSDRLYATTDRGVMEFDEQKNTFLPSARFEEKNVKKIFSFGQRKDWILTNSGALRSKTATNQWQEIPLPTNFLVDDYETIVSPDSSSRLLCRENGFAFLPSSEFITQNKGAPLIRSFSVEKFPELTRAFSAPATETIELKYNQNNLTVGFISTDFASSVRFSYWLENYSEQRSDFTENTFKEFNNLPPGAYTLHVRTNTSQREATLDFVILPPWYWNAWSKPGYFSLFCLVVFGLYRLHVRRLIAQNEAFMRQKAQALEDQEERNRQEIIRIRNEQLEQDLVRKSEELANSTMELIKKNELFQGIQEKVHDIQQNHRPSDFQQLSKLIETHISTGKDWHLFEQNFNQVHEQFFKKLLELYPELSKGDLKLAAYLRMNLSSKEISQLLNITYRSVELKRYRLRKKMHLESEENLVEFMMSI